MKRAEFVDLFEGLVRAHALLEGSGSHVPQSQASEQVFASKWLIDSAVKAVRNELKK